MSLPATSYTSFRDPYAMSYGQVGAYSQYPTQMAQTNVYGQSYGTQSMNYGGGYGYAVPQTASYMVAPAQGSFYPAHGYSSASFFQPAPYNPYDWSQTRDAQPATSQMSSHNQATSRSGVKNTSHRRSHGKEAILVIKSIVNVPKSFGELGNGRYQVAAWCRNEDRDQNAIKRGYCTQLVSASSPSSGDPRNEDVHFNYAKIRVPWDGEEVIQVKVFTDETVQNYQKTEALGTLALSLQDPDSKDMLAYPITGANKEQKGYMYCTAELVDAGQPSATRRGAAGEKKKNDDPWCFCL